MHNRKRGYCSQQQDDNAKMKHKHTLHTHSLTRSRTLTSRNSFCICLYFLFAVWKQQPEILWNVSVCWCVCVFLLTLIFNSATLLHLLFVILFKCRPIFTWRIRNGKVILPMNKMLNEGAFLSLALSLGVCVYTHKTYCSR